MQPLEKKAKELLGILLMSTLEQSMLAMGKNGKARYVTAYPHAGKTW